MVYILRVELIYSVDRFTTMYVDYMDKNWLHIGIEKYKIHTHYSLSFDLRLQYSPLEIIVYVHSEAKQLFQSLSINSNSAKCIETGNSF